MINYAMSGYLLECPHHGILYKSREYWYGNEEPEKVVRTEIKHVWKDQKFEFMGTSLNTGRKVIDVFNYLGDIINEPKDLACQYLADRVAPSYWIPNAEIINCSACKIKLEKSEDKHHCRYFLVFYLFFSSFNLFFLFLKLLWKRIL
jgi:zinc finger FYVE domain-containing protein 1